MSITFSLGSSSKIKRDAFEKALGLVGLSGASPAVIPVSSGVNEQPVGVEEIALGAHNRARAAMAAVPGSLGVGIESGIIYGASDANESDIGWSDVALVVIMLPDGREYTRWSRAIRLPRDLVNKAMDRGFATCTVGKVIAEVHGGDAADPLPAMTRGKYTREAVLTEAVAGALNEAGAFAREVLGITITSYDITIGHVITGKVRRTLPVREVAPGVHVALFNILGDWELTEVAGKTLALKMRLAEMRCDALVMPDGKATALLHVLGRDLKLPAFVARKERKPYMGDSVRSVTYRSITTNREQSLFLSADDAAALKGKRVIIVDDVVSTGGSIDATKALMAEVGADVTGVAAIFCEGKDREDVCSLGLLPLF